VRAELPASSTKSPIRASAWGIRAEMPGIEAVQACDVRKGVAVAVAQVPSLVDVDGPGEKAGSEAGHTKPGALLFWEHRDGQGPVRHFSAAIRMSTAASADATPSGPSKAPPPGTESRWLPVTRAPICGFPHHAQMMPLRSVSTAKPRWSACWMNHALGRVPPSSTRPGSSLRAPRRGRRP
jgi:hypothetical protein